MQIEVQKTSRANGRDVTKGDVVELLDPIAARWIERGLGREAKPGQTADRNPGQTADKRPGKPATSPKREGSRKAAKEEDLTPEECAVYDGLSMGDLRAVAKEHEVKLGFGTTRVGAFMLLKEHLMPPAPAAADAGGDGDAEEGAGDAVGDTGGEQPPA